MNNIKFSKGFTLVELLIVLVLIGLVSGVAGNIISIVLRADNKSSMSAQIQKTGDYIISQFSNSVRNAQSFIAVSTNPTSDCRETLGNVKVSGCIYSDGDANGNLCGSTTSYSMVEYTDTNGNVSAISCSGTPPTPYFLTFDSSPIPATPTIQPWVSSSIAVKSCEITCSQAAANQAPVIGISFTLGSANVSGAGETNQPDQTFQTSVLMRN